MNVEMNKCKEVINDFLVEEFGDVGDFSNPRHIDICYTTLGDDNSISTQVYADLVARAVIRTESSGVTGEINVPFVYAFSNLTAMAVWMRGNLNFEWIVFEAEGHYYQDELGVVHGCIPFNYEEED